MSTSEVRISLPWFFLYGSVLCLKTKGEMSTVYSQMVKSWSLHITGLIHLFCSNPCSRVPTGVVTTIDLVRVKAFKLQSFGRQGCIYGVAIQTMTQISQFGGCIRITQVRLLQLLVCPCRLQSFGQKQFDFFLMAVSLHLCVTLVYPQYRHTAQFPNYFLCHSEKRSTATGRAPSLAWACVSWTSTVDLETLL